MNIENSINSYGQRSDLKGVDQTKLDLELIERAREGDTEAFGELILAHRERARRWAERITRDPHMAEDVVQDALIRAFLHLGTLMDTSRFLPWLHRIVQNQANMRLRRGGPFHREQPITNWLSAERGANGQVNWEDVESILSYLSVASIDSTEHQNDPAEQILRKEMYETIHSLLHCLNRKERGIFEAYFFRQLSPDEIASMFNTTKGSVYTYLHRSREKLRQVNIHAALGLHNEGGKSVMKQRKLLLPDWPINQSVMITFVDRIRHLLATLGDERSISELMGRSGFAFRMKISNKTTFADGIYVFDWRQLMQTFIRDLGYEVTILCGQLSNSPVPLQAVAERFPVVLPIEESILPFIRKYVDKGIPVLYFDTIADQPFVHEWSLIYGYDDEKRVVYLTDFMIPKGKVISYEEVAGNPLRFIAGIDGKARITEETRKQTEINQVARVLQFAIDYARHGCEYVPRTGYLSYTSGLATYERWIDYMRNPRVTPNRYGMGQLAAVYGETKRHAAEYLRRVPFEGEAKRLLLLAAEAYVEAARMLEGIRERVPFVRNAELLSDESRKLCAIQLEKARDFEKAAISYLENSLQLLGWENSR